MPKRKRAKEQQAPGIRATAVDRVDRVESEQERAAKLFAESVRSHEAADRAERQRLKEADDRAARHRQLQADKQSAADLIKRLRSSERRGTQMADAEAAYRLALAELQEFETGERPHWAPARPVEPDEDVADGEGPAEAGSADDADGNAAEGEPLGA